MKPQNKIFFAEHGITSTSANFLANLAKEEITKDQADLDAADFLNVSLNIVGSNSAPMIVSEGKDEIYVNNIDKLLKHCAAMNSFCAWMREAIKAKEDEESYWRTYSFNSWATEVEHIVVPTVGYSPVPTQEDVIGDMNIKEREEYYMLEATAASYGKYIHEHGPFNTARKALHRGLAKPTWKEGSGRDTLIYNNSAATQPEIVDKKFEELQNQHRSFEQRLNSIKAKIKEELSRRMTKRHLDSMAETQRVTGEVEVLQAKYAKFIQEKLEEVNKLKIAIPEKLKSTYEYLNSKGKESEE